VPPLVGASLAHHSLPGLLAGNAASSGSESEGLIAASYDTQHEQGSGDGSRAGLWSGVQQAAAGLRAKFGAQLAGDADKWKRD